MLHTCTVGPHVLMYYKISFLSRSVRQSKIRQSWEEARIANPPIITPANISCYTLWCVAIVCFKSNFPFDNWVLNERVYCIYLWWPQISLLHVHVHTLCMYFPIPALLPTRVSKGVCQLISWPSKWFHICRPHFLCKVD